jgi:RNA polymerase sigma-70 factor (ECF subfamily)
VGSTARFDAVFRLSYQRVLAYCLRRAPEPMAHDATAEVFAVAWRRRRDLPDDDGAVPWLLAIARRVLANEMRGARRRDRLAMTVAAEPDPSADASDFPVTSALDDLPEDDREVLRLVYWDDLSHAEIAQVLGISVNAVGVRAHRARARVKARLEQETRCQPT